MPRYIDAEKIEFRKIPAVDCDGDILLSLSAVIRAIQQAPTEDVKPVMYGHWKPYQTPIGTRQAGWICTNCSGINYDLSNGDSDYCPCCGAEMNLEIADV